MDTAEMVLTREQARLLRFAAVNDGRLSTGRWQAAQVRTAVAALVRMGMLSAGRDGWRYLTVNGRAWLDAHPTDAVPDDKENN